MSDKPTFEETDTAFIFNGHYTITYERCDTSEKVLSWVVHLADKTWVTKDLIQEFIVSATKRIGFDVYTAA